MSNLQFDTSVNVDNIKTGNTPPEIKIYYSEGNKMGNYYYCFPTRMEQKSFKAAETWVSGTPKFDIVKNEFKQIKLFGVGERAMTNRRLFKVLLNNKYIVELEEEMLFHALSYFSCSKSNFTGVFKYGLLNSSFKLYPETPPFKDKMKELTKVFLTKNKFTDSTKVLDEVLDIKSNVKQNIIYKISRYHNDCFLYLGKNNNKENVYLKFRDPIIFSKEYEKKYWSNFVKEFLENYKKKKQMDIDPHTIEYSYYNLVVCKKSYKHFTFKYNDIKINVTSSLSDIQTKIEEYIDNRDIESPINIQSLLEIYKNIFSNDKYEKDKDVIIEECNTKYQARHNRKHKNNNMDIDDILLEQEITAIMGG